MSPRLTIVQNVAHHLHQLLPGIRVTRSRTLAVLVLGMLWAGVVSLPRIAAVVPLAARPASRERRLQRWLANNAVDVRAIWRTLLPVLLAGKTTQELTIVFDPTPHNDRFTLLVLGLVVHRRVVPIAWRLVPQQDGPWETSQTAILGQLMDEVAAALPADCTVTLVGDRGVTGPKVIDECRRVGWHFVLRLNVGPTHPVMWRATADGPEVSVWSLVTRPGQRWSGTGEVYKLDGWHRVTVTIWWARTAAVPWILLSDRPGGSARVREYRRRVRCEATYQDLKQRGFDLERSKLRDLARLDRLLLALVLAYWWMLQLGLRVIRTGHRCDYDRPDRREWSLLRLGRAALETAAAQGRCPPLPCHWHRTEWRYTWLA